MFSTLRTRFGIPGVISVMALVFAMFGGAYAASNSSGGGKATASKAKVKKGPRGPRGATGPAGPTGPQGPAGPAGAKGEKGDAGAAGSAGTPGAPGAAGQSVTTANEPPLGNCGDVEGVKLTSTSGTNYVCNGAPGNPGPVGSPWTAGGTLPGGSTETGTWSAYGGTSDAGGMPASISFPIPLAAAIPVANVHYVTSPGGSCTGSAANPTAASGHLCVYQGFVTKLVFGEINGPNGAPGAGVSGAVIGFAPTGSPALGFGSWAVTAPTS